MKIDENIVGEIRLQNKEILNELSIIEETLKILLVNNVLSDIDSQIQNIEKSKFKEEPVQPFDIDNFESEVVAEYQNKIDYFDNKLKNMIGRSCVIRHECEEFYDEAEEKTELSNNLRKKISSNYWYFEISDYKSGMFKITRKELKFWVPFDMIKET